MIAAGDISGKLGETAVLYTNGKIKAERVMVVGLGESEKFSIDEIRRAAASAVWTAEKYRSGMRQP